MKHPVWDRILILLCALAALSGAAGVVMLLIGKISLETIVALILSLIHISACSSIRERIAFMKKSKQNQSSDCFPGVAESCILVV